MSQNNRTPNNNTNFNNNYYLLDPVELDKQLKSLEPPRVVKLDDSDETDRKKCNIC